MLRRDDLTERCSGEGDNALKFGDQTIDVDVMHQDITS